MNTASTPPEAVDTRIDAPWIIPVEPNRVLHGHSLILRDGRILDILPQSEAGKYQPAEHVRLPGHALIPGLVNLHTHAAMNLLRGFADDLPLMEWLQKHIWPAEGRWMSPDFVRDGTRLACLEMLKGGVTCFNDMYFFPEAAVEAAIEARMRLAAGLIVVDAPTPYAADPDGYLHKGMALRDRVQHELISYCLAPHAPYTTSNATLEKVVTYAAQLDLPVHIHVHETEDEIQHSLTDHGLRPLARLRNLGLLGPNLIGVHMVRVDEAELGVLASHACHVAHCPSSNLKLASGLAPVARMLELGINVGLGTDGAASNNRLDLWEEMRLAALLAKGVSGRADALPAHQALAMATINGARALGMNDQIGSLAAGKQADLVAVDLSGEETQPCYDPISSLVYSAGRQQVRRVWVAGEAVVVDGRCLSLDEPAAIRRAEDWRGKMAEV